MLLRLQLIVGFFFVNCTVEKVKQTLTEAENRWRILSALLKKKQ